MLLLLLLHLLLLHLLCTHLLLHLVLAHGLGLELFDVLRHRHASLLRLNSELTLHGLDLLGGRLLARLKSCGHQVDLWLALRLTLLRRHLLLLRRRLRWCRHFVRQ